MKEPISGCLELALTYLTYHDGSTRITFAIRHNGKIPVCYYITHEQWVAVKQMTNLQMDEMTERASNSREDKLLKFHSWTELQRD